MKDHEIRELINALRDIASEHYASESLRDRIANCLVPKIHALAEKIKDLGGQVNSASGDDYCRLNWLEQKAKQSRSGVSFDFIRYSQDGRVTEHGYRVMWRHRLGPRFRTLREAIDHARELEG